MAAAAIIVAIDVPPVVVAVAAMVHAAHECVAVAECDEPVPVPEPIAPLAASLAVYTGGRCDEPGPIAPLVAALAGSVGGGCVGTGTVM